MLFFFFETHIRELRMCRQNEIQKRSLLPTKRRKKNRQNSNIVSVLLKQKKYIYMYTHTHSKETLSQRHSIQNIIVFYAIDLDGHFFCASI